MNKVLWRGGAHVLVGGACAVTLWLAPHWIAIGLLAAGCLLFLFLDFARWRDLAIYRGIAFVFRPFLRESEEHDLSGAFYLLAGSLIVGLLFNRPLAVTAVFFLTFGDSSATVAGTLVGRTRLGRKSLEGSLACLLACALVALTAYLLRSPISPPALSAGVVGAAVLEGLPWKFNDNLTLPVGSAALIFAVTRAIS